VWLKLADLFPRELANRETIFDTPAIKVFEERYFRAVAGDNYFSTNLMGYAVLFAKLKQPLVAFNGEARFKTSGFVVNAGMNNAAVSARLVARDILLFFQDNQPESRLSFR